MTCSITLRGAAEPKSIVGVAPVATTVPSTSQRTDAVDPAANSTRGENVAAFVVLEPGASVAAEDLRRACGGLLASYKLPRHIFWIEARDVPRTGSGKVEKPALRREAERRLSGEGAGEE